MIKKVDDVYEIHFKDNKVKIFNVMTKEYLKVYIAKSRYPIVYMYNKPKAVNNLVAALFIGKRKFGYVIRHRDGDKRNYHPYNLEYIWRHAVKVGRPSNKDKRISKRMQEVFDDEAKEMAKIMKVNIHTTKRPKESKEELRKKLISYMESYNEKERH